MARTAGSRHGRFIRALARLTGAVALMAVVGVGSASAGVIYLDLDPDRLVSGGNFIWDVDNDGTKDLILSHEFNCVGNCHTFASVSALSGQILLTGTDVTPLGAGVIVGPASVTFGGHGLLAEDFFAGNPVVVSNENGLWDDNRLAFLGFSFANATGLHYGWARLKVSELNNEVTVYDAAYDDTIDTAIATPAAAPEPAVLGLILLGAVGVAAHRFRRRA